MLYFYGLFATFKEFLIMVSAVDMKVGISGSWEGCAFTPGVYSSVSLLVTCNLVQGLPSVSF